MDTKLAVSEFANMIRVGSHALKGLLANKDEGRARRLEPPINELLFMLDRFEELAGELEAVDSERSPRDRRA